jgi:glycosyltransferase involved in cell wall biosynthesis
MRKVAFLFSRKITDTPALIETLKRLDTYSRRYQEASGQKLTVCFFQEKQILDLEALELDLEFQWKSYRHFRFLRTTIFLVRNFKNWRLIAADLWTDFPLLLTAKFLSRNRIWIQISIHGDLYGTKTNLPIKLYKSFISMFFRFSDSCRLVSEELHATYSARLGIPEERILISPIPVSDDYLNQQDFHTADRALGYVGRIHVERGYEEWSQIANSYLLHNRSALFKIIGGGSDLSIFQERMSKTISEKTTFYGRLESQELSKSWDKFHILLRCAENEGYGLAIREAIVRGKIVIAKRNPGTMSLQSKYPQCIYLYSSVEEAVVLLNDLWEISAHNECSHLMRRDLLEEKELSLAALIASWTN